MVTPNVNKVRLVTKRMEEDFQTTKVHEVYSVEFTSPSAIDINAARTATDGTTTVNSSETYDIGGVACLLFGRNVNIVEDNSPIVLVMVDWQSETFETPYRETPGSIWRSSYSCSSVLYSETSDVNAYGNSEIKNSLGQYFGNVTPKTVLQYWLPRHTISFRTDVFPSAFQALQGKINDEDITISFRQDSGTPATKTFAATSLLCSEVSVQAVYEKDYLCYDVQIILDEKYNPNATAPLIAPVTWVDQVPSVRQDPPAYNDLPIYLNASGGVATYSGAFIVNVDRFIRVSFSVLATIPEL